MPQPAPQPETAAQTHGRRLRQAYECWQCGDFAMVDSHGTREFIGGGELVPHPETAAQTHGRHKPIAVAEPQLRGDVKKLALRARGRLQHTLHSCGGISDAGAGAEMLSLVLRNSDHGSAARAGGCSTNPWLRRSLDCGSAGAEMLKLALRKPITGVPRAREAAAQTHSCGKFYLRSSKP